MMAPDSVPVVFRLKHLKAALNRSSYSRARSWRRGRSLPGFGAFRNPSWIHDFAGVPPGKWDEFFVLRRRSRPTTKLRPVRSRIRYFFPAQEQVQWFRCDELPESGLGWTRWKRGRATWKRVEGCPNNRPVTGYFAAR